MNRLELYLVSVIDTVEKGRHFVTHNAQFRILESSLNCEISREVFDNSSDFSVKDEQYIKKPMSKKVVRYHGRKGRG